MEGATPSRSVRVHLIYREGREAPESLLATRGPQSCPEPHPSTICVKNVKITPKAK